MINTRNHFDSQFDSTVVPLFSIVIPTYNQAYYLDKALQSVINQTYKNWEVIVVDNNSTDKTDEVIKSFVDPRINYFKIHNYGIIAASRNAGIRLAKGEWVAFLDSDDWWTNDKLEVCFGEINQKVDLLYHDLEIADGESLNFRRKTIKSWQVKKPVLMDLLLKGNAIANSSVVVRKRLLEEIGGLNESAKMIAAEDYNAWLRISKLTNQFLYLPRKLGYYLIHNQGVSKKDMSKPYIESTKEFICDLGERKRKIVESKAAYMSGRYYYLEKEYKIATLKLIESIAGGSSEVVLRTIFLLTVIFFKNLTRLLPYKK